MRNKSLVDPVSDPERLLRARRVLQFSQDMADDQQQEGLGAQNVGDNVEDRAPPNEEQVNQCAVLLQAMQRMGIIPPNQQQQQPPPPPQNGGRRHNVGERTRFGAVGEDRVERELDIPLDPKFVSNGMPPVELGFEIRPELVNMVGQHPFGGMEHEEPQSHLTRFLRMCSMIKMPGVSEDAMRIRMFPVFVDGERIDVV